MKQREIKFRAWNKVWGMMSLVDKIEFEDEKPVSVSTTIEATDFDHTDEWSDYEVGDEIILQQFTGLKDKNGKEIYEGDIIKYGRFKCEVVWRSTQWMIRNISLGGDCCFAHSKDEWSSFKVIGNIYENPNFLT